MSVNAGIIKFDRFSDKSISDLKGAEDSARFIQTIMEGGRNGTKPLYRFSAAHANGNPHTVEGYISETFEKTDKDDTIFLYIVGHGQVSDEDGLLWLPTEKTDISGGGEANWVKFRGNITNKLKNTGNFSRAIVFLDTCHSGNQSTERSAEGQIPLDASGAFATSTKVEFELKALEAEAGSKDIMFLTSSSRNQKSFEIKPYLSDRLPKLMEAYRDWDHAPKEATRMTAFAHAVGLAVFLGDTGVEKLKLLNLNIVEADLASRIIRLMKYDDDGDVTLPALKDAVQLILSKLDTSQTPQLLSEDEGVFESLAGVRTLKSAKKDLRRKLGARVDSLQHATTETRKELKDFIKKMSVVSSGGHAMRDVETPTVEDFKWEDKLFQLLDLPEPEFLELYIAARVGRNIENAVATRQRELEGHYELRVQDRDERIKGFKNETTELKTEIRLLQGTLREEKAELNGKVRWWRGFSQYLMGLVGAVAMIFIIIRSTK